MVTKPASQPPEPGISSSQASASGILQPPTAVDLDGDMPAALSLVPAIKPLEGRVQESKHPFASPPVTTGEQDDDEVVFDDEPVLSSEATVKPNRRGLMVLLSLIAFGYGAYFVGAIQGRGQVPVAAIPAVTLNATTAQAVQVHVTGAVKNPGLYRLPFDARVNDAVQAAGGAVDRADLERLNLAAWVEDGSRIEVPSKTAPLGHAFVRSIPATQPSLSATSDPGSRPPAPPQAPTKAGSHEAKSSSGKPSANYLQTHPVNLNEANLQQLQQLPGIGPAMAQRILDYRQEAGGFREVAELDNVSGIGPKKLEKLRPLVTVR